MPEPRSVVGCIPVRDAIFAKVVKESLNKLSRRAGGASVVLAGARLTSDADSDLRRQFNDEVPVVFIDGRKAFKYRMDEQEFLRKLAS